jgi:N-acetylneuraminate synthase
VGVSIAAVALGATVIEKHLTLKRANGGVDSAFSVESHEMKALAEETYKAWQALGEIYYGAIEKEKASMVFRRSIYVSEDMKAGEVFTRENLRIIRPGKGMSPKYYEVFLGKRIMSDAKKGTPLTWDMVG